MLPIGRGYYHKKEYAPHREGLLLKERICSPLGGATIKGKNMLPIGRGYYQKKEYAPHRRGYYQKKEYAFKSSPFANIK